MELRNEERFTSKADIYKKSRPTYPKALIDYLYAQVGFSAESIVADIGSGTGIFSRLLVEQGSLVYGVEPNDDMRRVAEKDMSAYDRFISINAPAESTGLHINSVNFIVAAQAFHWFDRKLFHVECRRILKPGGKVVLIWNTRDYENEIIKKEYMIRNKYFMGKEGMEDGSKLAKDLSDFYAEGICEYKTCKNDLTLTRDTYIGMNLSRSWSPREDQNPEMYHGLVGALGALFDEYQVNGVLHFPYFTQSYTGSV